MRICFLQYSPEYEALEEDYAFEKTFEVEAQRRIDDEPLVSALGRFMIFLKNNLLNRDKLYWLLAKYVKSGDVVVDVGCGSGNKIAQAVNKFKHENSVSIIPIGLEISIGSAKDAIANLDPLGINACKTMP